MTRLHIINMALLRCGLPLATNIHDSDWNAQFIYETAVESLLRGYAWNFARGHAVLTEPLPETPATHLYAYELPSDCAHVVDCRASQAANSPLSRHEIAGNTVLANDRPLYVRYTRRLLEPDMWPQDFCQAVSARIAQEIAALSAEAISMVPQLMQIAEYNLGQAQLNDAREIAAFASSQGGPVGSLANSRK